MKKAIFILGSLTLLAAFAEGIILLQVRGIDVWRLGALIECLALILGAFVGLNSTIFVRQLRQWAVLSPRVAVGLPFSLLVPYFIYAFGTGTFTWLAAGKLAAYIAVPNLLLLPDRLRHAERVGWRDFAAMLALAVPVSANWLENIWTWPQDIYIFRPLFCVCAGGYAFLVVRNLEGVGYRLLPNRKDAIDGVANFVAFSLLGIPLGIALGFIHPHTNSVSLADFGIEFFGIYLTIAIPEEFLFRGVLQNFLERSIPGGRHGLYGLLIASAIFGASHLHHAPVPNWRYGVMATLAGIFYGNAYRSRKRLPASALTHTLVDTMWRFWF